MNAKDNDEKYSFLWYTIYLQWLTPNRKYNRQHNHNKYENTAFNTK